MPRSGYAICTSEQRPASTTVSHGFAVGRRSSPPFGSHGTLQKHSEPCPMDCGPGDPMQVCCDVLYTFVSLVSLLCGIIIVSNANENNKRAISSHHKARYMWVCNIHIQIYIYLYQQPSGRPAAKRRHICGRCFTHNTHKQTNKNADHTTICIYA